MSNVNHSTRVWGIIPAAGLGRRMGRPKQTLTYRGSTMAGTVTTALLTAGASGVVVVTRTELVERLQLPDDSRIDIAINDDPDSEMIDSIRIGIAALDRFQPGERDGVLVVPADMPTLAAQSGCVCMETFRSTSDRIIVATHHGKRGHPIIFPYAMRRIVSNLTGGLRMLPRIHEDRVTLVEVDDPGVRLDVDTNEDYKKL